MAQTTMCDKIQTIGTNLQNNLNARGVTCTFGNTNGHTIYDLAQLVNERNLKGIGDTNLKIMASNPYCVSGDTTDIIVLLRDGVGTPITNQEVTVSDGTNEHTLTTDANGKATLYNQTITTTKTYTATYGSVIASCKVKDIADSLLGETYYLMNNLTTIRANNPYSQVTLSSSSDWKITGEQSLKLVVGSSAHYFGIRTGSSYLNIDDDIKGKTVKLSAYINSPKQSVLRIYRSINNSWVYTNGQTVVDSGLHYAEVTSTIESDAQYCWFRLDTYNNSWSNGDVIYTDGWTLEIIE